MKALIRLIAFTIIIFLGTHSALENCVHISTPDNAHAVSSSGDHSPSSTAQTSDHACLCSLSCQVSLEVNYQIPTSLTLIGHSPLTSYPEQFLTSSQFSTLPTKPPIA
jgi:hypothetical protein